MAKELLERVARALSHADLEPLRRAISDEIIWKSAATEKGFFRFGGQYRGREGVEKLIREVETDYMIRSLTPKEVTSSGDVMWGLFRADLIYKRTLAQLSFDMVVHWRLREGKVVEHQAFIDTAAMLVREQNGLLGRS